MLVGLIVQSPLVSFHAPHVLPLSSPPSSTPFSPRPPVSLTPLPGFHQCDLWGSLHGLLMAHPSSPLLSLHHLPGLDSVLLHAGVTNRVAALSSLAQLIEPDPVGFAQLAVCHDR